MRLGASLLPMVGRPEECSLVTPQNPRDLGIGGSVYFRWLGSRFEKKDCICTPRFCLQHCPWQDMGDLLSGKGELWA